MYLKGKMLKKEEKKKKKAWGKERKIRQRKHFSLAKRLRIQRLLLLPIDDWLMLVASFAALASYADVGLRQSQVPSITRNVRMACKINSVSIALNYCRWYKTCLQRLVKRIIMITQSKRRFMCNGNINVKIVAIALKVLFSYSTVQLTPRTFFLLPGFNTLCFLPHGRAP